MAAISTLGLTAERAAALLDAREISCEELAGAYLDRIAADTDTGAYLHTHPERTLARARELDAAGRSGVAGVPIGLKDLLSTRGVPTTAGSRILEGFRPIIDADVVEAVQDAGLVSLGKLNMDEFAMGSSTEHSAYQLTRNPWDPARVPGRLVGRLGGGGGRRPRAAGARHRHRRLDPPAGRVLRRRRPEADVRRASRATAWSRSPRRSTRSGRSRTPSATWRC